MLWCTGATKQVSEGSTVRVQEYLQPDGLVTGHRNKKRNVIYCSCLMLSLSYNIQGGFPPTLVYLADLYIRKYTVSVLMLLQCAACHQH